MPLSQFEVIPADTARLRDASFALRHEVFCRELGFEPERANGLEHDAYDERARHYLLAHRSSGAWAGCVRIVPADDASPGLGLPFEAAPVRLLDEAAVDLAALPRGSLGEISRLTVAAGFRRRVRDGPPAVLGTALVAVAAAAEAGLSSALCLMQPSLERQLLAHGIRFARLSAPVDHHGHRALFQLSPSATCVEVEPELRRALAAIRSRIAGRGP